MSKAYIGITDKSWFNFLSLQQGLDEVNFWRPSVSNIFRALNPGEIFLFRLHSPDDYIVGGGFFAHYSQLPISLAWEAFGKGNGANSLLEMRNKIERYRGEPTDLFDDFEIGCILLEKPFFFPREKWFSVPNDWKTGIQTGKTYNLETEPGLTLFRRLKVRLSEMLAIAEEPARYGEATQIFPRLGQGSFRILVTDVYERRCAVTKERTLPALEAAHIKPFSIGGSHEIRNGILLRKDFHALLDKGYITISPQMTLEVSRRIKEEFENGREYYAHHGQNIFTPSENLYRPSSEILRWHNDNVFRG